MCSSFPSFASRAGSEGPSDYGSQYRGAVLAKTISSRSVHSSPKLHGHGQRVSSEQVLGPPAPPGWALGVQAQLPPGLEVDALGIRGPGCLQCWVLEGLSTVHQVFLFPLTVGSENPKPSRAQKWWKSKD